MSRNLFSYETLVHATAGSAGSIVAMSVFYPLDTVRFRLQVELDSELKNKSTLHALYHIFKEEGFEALYRGLKPVLISLASSNFVYFYTFHGLKSLIKSNQIQNDLILGVIAGAINVFLTTPLWVVNSRLKSSPSQHFSGLLDGLIHIANTEGLSSLWSGIGPSLILVSNPAIHFTVYEALKRRFSPKTALAFFVTGAAAKAVATVLTYPLQLAQARQRHGARDGRMNMVVLLLAILKKKGPGALYRGLEAKLWQTVLTTALMFMTYEKIARFVFVLLLRRSHSGKVV